MRAGGQAQTAGRSIKEIPGHIRCILPIFVHAGAILPDGEPEHHGGEIPDRSARPQASAHNAYDDNEEVKIAFIKVFDDADTIAIEVDYA